MSASVRVLLLPGWLNSGEGHWQSRWERLYGYQRVEQADWVRPLRGDWMARLEEVVLQDAAPVVLAAHSLGCHLVAAWAAHSQHANRVQGALLVAPPDPDRPDFPPQLASWRRAERGRLPFSALLVCSEDDPYCGAPQAQALADDWGASLCNIGQAGHINADSGLGNWPAGHAWLQGLVTPP